MHNARVLAVHNYYQQRGGEDQCFDDLVDILRKRGHEVLTYTVHNDSIADRNRLGVAVGTIWNRRAARRMRQMLREFQPDVVHAVNTFPLLSPAVLATAKRAGIPTLIEVGNYRFACAGGVFIRDGQRCERCLHKALPWPAVAHRCYRQSLAGSIVTATAISSQRILRTWTRATDWIICPSRSARQKLLQMGIPADRIIVKSHSLSYDPAMSRCAGETMMFVGRLSPEKGVTTLLEAWRLHPELPRLTIVGSGPLDDLVRNAADNDPRIGWLGALPVGQVHEQLGAANCLIVPSVVEETFGRVTVEAFARGTPVIGANLGATAELISEGENGFLFAPGDPDALASTLLQFIRTPRHASLQMRQAARKTFEERFTAEVHYKNLLELYARATQNPRQSFSDETAI